MASSCFLVVNFFSTLIVPLLSRIPNGTSPELTNLLFGLLKRDARDRIDFDTFFNHPFIRPEAPAAPPLPPVTITAPTTAAVTKPVNVPSASSSTPVSNSTTPRNSAPSNVPGALPPSPVAMSKSNHYYLCLPSYSRLELQPDSPPLRLQSPWDQLQAKLPRESLDPAQVPMQLKTRTLSWFQPT